MAGPNLICGRFATALLITTLTASLFQPAHAIVIFRNDFEDDPVGIYSVANLAADWNGTTSNDGVDEGRVSITDDANAFGSKSLVVMYPQGESNLGKSQWKVPLGAGYEELFVSYRLRFDDNFDFVRGGKLPGLSGGADNTGGNKPNGTDGWSARMMWRTNGSGGSPTTGDTANIVQYAYHPDQPTEFGDDMRWDDGTPAQWQVFESDRWRHVQHRVVMNTPGEHDGVIQAWLDGRMVLDRQDIRFRDVASLQIDNFYFSTFFGGSSAAWEAAKNERVYYDDFVIATEFIATPGDFDFDGDVDADDLVRWEGDFGDTFGGDEFLTWQRQFIGNLSSAQPTATAVPEPSGAVLLMSVAASHFSFRRRRNTP